MIKPEDNRPRFFNELVDDKLHVIWALTAVAIVTIIMIPEEANIIVTNIVSGLLGVAVGKGSAKT